MLVTDTAPPLKGTGAVGEGEMLPISITKLMRLTRRRQIARSSDNIGAAILPTCTVNPDLPFPLSAAQHRASPAAVVAPPLRAAKLTANTLEAIRNCTNDLMKHVPLKECANCKAVNPTIRRHAPARLVGELSI